MIVSVNWLKKYIDFDISIDELADIISERLVEVEEVIDLGKRYKDCKIVKVVSHEKLKGSDHLNVCQVDVGDKDLVQIVCGANNVHDDMLAVWLPPESIVPETFDSEPLILTARPLMGVLSNGMMASMRELGLGDEHDGIIELEPGSAKPGESFAEIFELNDTLLDIENKSLTHRPDCFGIIGFAREVAGVLGQTFEEPDIFHKDNLNLGEDISKNIDLKIEINDPKLCPRYSAAVLDLSHQNSSVYLNQMQVDIAKVGMRPIDRIVDITNYLMLLTGQPLHAFDYDKLVKIGGEKKAKIIVRSAKNGEKLELLDGKQIECDSKDILITANNKPVALAGAMGGASTAIDDKTQRIIIESATFNLFNMRGTQFRHGIFSEAITRFTKGQPEKLTVPVLNEACKILGGKIINKVDEYPKPIITQPIIVPVELVNNLLGTNYDFDIIITTLQNVGFIVKLEGDKLKIKTPWWRTDIHIAEDVIEEIGRLKGYNEIPLSSPNRSFKAPKPDELGNIKKKIRTILSESGANEILTYSFISERLLNQVGQDPKNSYKIVNSISPKLQYIRQSLTPSILEKIWLNTKVPYEHFALFEINQVYQKSYGLTDEKVPVLRDKVALTICDRKSKNDAYYEALRQAKNLLEKLNIKYDIVPMTDSNASNIPFESKRSSQIKTPDHEVCFGVVGEFRNTVLENLKLPKYTAGFEFNLDKLIDKSSLTKFNSLIEKTIKNDITFKVNVDLKYQELISTIQNYLERKSVTCRIEPISIWQGDDKKSKNISIKLILNSDDKSLNTKEIAAIMEEIAIEAKGKIGAQVI